MNGNKKIVHFLSASDRINYGDLLFPIIFKKYIETKSIVFINYGIIQSDLSFFGAMPTDSYKNFQKNVKKNGGNVIVGGGEVFFAEWNTLYSFASPLFSKLFKYKFFKKIDSKFNIAKHILSKGSILIPFAPSVRELKNNRIGIFYNSVGGEFSSRFSAGKRDKIKTNLLSANHISVRDTRVVNSLNKYDIKSVLVPDSALIMSDLFSISELKLKTTIDQELIKDKYIFVQIGVNKRPKNLIQFAKDLDQELSKLNAKAILCPIGLAPNHEDDIILRELEKLSSKFKFVLPNNLYDVMYLIANATAYAGTSLHGLITAQSFNVPFIPLNENIDKLDVYCKTWTISTCKGCIEFEKINELSKILESWKFNEIKKETIAQKKSVYNNLNYIITNLV